jgi:hypothetical protein
MTRTLFPVVLGAVIAIGFAVVPAFADTMPKDGAAKSTKAAMIKPVAIRTRKKAVIVEKRDTKIDYYKVEREKMMKISM